MSRVTVEARYSKARAWEREREVRVIEKVGGRAFDFEPRALTGIISTEYPSGTAHSDNKAALPEIFEGSVNGAVANVAGKLLSDQAIEINGYPGREFRIDFQDGLAVIKMRSYLVKNKMFILQTICDPKKEGNAAAERFFASFKLKY